MKKNLFLLFVLISFSVQAQYLVNTSNIVYQELDTSTSISINNGSVWNENSIFPVNFNFNFNIYGQTFTSLNVVAGGGIRFVGTSTKQLYVMATTDAGLILRDKGITTSHSPLSYEVSGPSGSQVLKLQWENAGVKGLCGNLPDTTDFFDLQIWLFENDNHLEVHFGNSSADLYTYGYPNCNSTTTPGFQISFQYDQCNNRVCLWGPSSQPNFMNLNMCGWQPSWHLFDTPASGTIYGFIPTNVGVKELEPSLYSVAPNPFDQAVNISKKTGSHAINDIAITNVLGELCYSRIAFSETLTEISIPTNHLPDGFYFIQLTFDDGSVLVNKIVKKSND